MKHLTIIIATSLMFLGHAFAQTTQEQKAPAKETGEM